MRGHLNKVGFVAVVFISFIAFYALNPFIHAEGPGTLSCHVNTTSCPSGYTKVLGMSNTTNAHAELANESNYNFVVCCKDSTGRNTIGTNNTVRSFNFLDLSNTTNAHVELGNGTNYNVEAYISGTLDKPSCTYPTSACSGANTCLATLSSNVSGASSNVTNLHVADCVTEPYATRVCCELVLNNTAPTIPVLISPPNGSTTTDRTPDLIWNNSVDADGDTLTYHLQLDDNSDFLSPEINQTGIANTTADNTSFTTSILDVDTIYFWRVRAFDQTDFSNFSGAFNFTVQSLVAINLTRNTINFSSMGLRENNDTSDNSPLPFLLENIGNIFANITVYATQFFSSGSFPSTAYMFKIGVNETGSFNSGQSTTSYTNMPSSSTNPDIVNLNWSVASNSAEIDINITVPGDEPSGSKSSTATVEVL